MNSKIQLYLWVLLLVILGLGLTLYKVSALDFPFLPGQSREVWVVEAEIDFIAHDAPVKVSLKLPAYATNLETIDEGFASPGYGFSLEESIDSPLRKAVWSSRKKTGPQKLYYQISLYNREKVFIADGSHFIPKLGPAIDMEEPYASSINEVVAAAHKRSSDAESFAKEITRRLEVKSGTQNAKLILAGFKKEGYSRNEVLSDMLTREGIANKVVRGLLLEDGKRHESLVEYIAFFDDTTWKFLDPKTAIVGYPQNFLVFSGAGLLDVEGGSNSKIRFSTVMSTQSARALAMKKNKESKTALIDFSIYSLPVRAQNAFRMLLLIPMGALVVVLIRNIVGVATSGTFMPILLAMALMETNLITGLPILLLVIIIGLLIRSYLTRLNLLLVPRIAAVVIVVVGIMAMISIIGYKLGFSAGLQVTLFPMIIISWTIERMSVLWEEQGAREVVRQGGGSLVVSILTLLVMSNYYVQYLTFTFPELLLLLLAVILLIGSYSGYRLSELIRFEPMIRGDHDAPSNT